MAVFWQQNDIKLKIRTEKLSSLERFKKTAGCALRTPWLAIHQIFDLIVRKNWLCQIVHLVNWNL